MNKVIGTGVIIILISLFGFIFFSSKQTAPDSSSSKNNTTVATTETSVTPITDIKASFAIFTNGTFRIFTASMYHNLSQDAYIEASNPNIVHVKKAGTTWNDFFSTLPFKLTSECLTTGTKETFCTNKNKSLKFFLNGEEKQDILNQAIKDADSLLVTYGNDSEESLKKQIQRASEF